MPHQWRPVTPGHGSPRVKPPPPNLSNITQNYSKTSIMLIGITYEEPPACISYTKLR